MSASAYGRSHAVACRQLLQLHLRAFSSSSCSWPVQGQEEYVDYLSCCFIDANAAPRPQTLQTTTVAAQASVSRRDMSVVTAVRNVSFRKVYSDVTRMLISA